MIIIGQAPSKTAGELRAFDGRCGAALAKLANLSQGEFLAKFPTHNLLSAYPGRKRLGRGDRFPMNDARRAAMLFHEMASRTGRDRGTHLRMLLVGERVATAFGLAHVEPFVWSNIDGVLYARMPHPSGLNRWWNDEANREQARKFMHKEVLRADRESSSRET